MQRFTVSRIAMLAVGLAAIGLTSGCVKKAPTEVDSTYLPEGRPASGSRLLAHAERPTVLRDYIDRPPIGVDAGDSLAGTREVYRNAPGTNALVLFDQTPSSKVEVLRREANGGWFSYKDFPIGPTRKWLDGQLEVYVLEDDAPSGFTPPTYMMRGVVGGQVTTESPLSNPGIIASRTVGDLLYSANAFPSDSLFNMAWVAVPGAVGYWIQVYQFLEAQQSDQILSGVPAPIYAGKSRDYFVGYVAAPNTSYKLGSPTGAEVYTRKTTLRGQTYLVRIAAVDNQGRMIAYTFGNFGVAFTEDGYSLFPLGAQLIRVQTAEPQLAPAVAKPAGVDAMLGDLPVVFSR